MVLCNKTRVYIHFSILFAQLSFSLYFHYLRGTPPNKQFFSRELRARQNESTEKGAQFGFGSLDLPICKQKAETEELSGVSNSLTVLVAKIGLEAHQEGEAQVNTPVLT